MNRPAWLPKWVWHPATWATHGAIQWAFFWLSPWAGAVALWGWWERERQDHRQNWPTRWPMDGLMDFAVPFAVQLWLWG